MLESLVLGVIQGVTEWLPVSSEGAVVLTNLYVFGRETGLGEMVRLALFLHLGTFFAALWYFRDDVRQLLKGLLTLPAAAEETRKILLFLFLATLVSGAVGYGLVLGLGEAEGILEVPARAATAVIGLLLLATAVLQLTASKRKKQPFGLKGPRDLRALDGLLLGLLQGISVLPGLSRSGLTISALLLRRFQDVQALRLSFLMSLPAILGGNIALALQEGGVQLAGVPGLFTSFLFGLLTIHLLLKFARAVNLGYFTLFFGLVTVGATLV